MTHAFDVRRGTVEDILAWFSETDAPGRNPWRLAEVHR